MTPNFKIERYIKNKNGEKVENRTKSVNITAEQDEFLKLHELNLSLMVRDFLDELMREPIENARKRKK